jgi:hypothetical protein
MRVKTFSELVAFLMLLTLPQAFAVDSPTCVNPTDTTPAKLPSDLTAAACKAFNDKPADIKKLLTELVKKNTHTLDRKVYFYHYGQNRNPNAGQPVDPNKGAANYFQSGTVSYFGSAPHRDDYGIYTATDPVMTLNYSQKPGILLRVGAPSGTSYLATGSTLSIEDGTRLTCYLRTQCDPAECKQLEEIIHEWLNSMGSSLDENGNRVPDPIGFEFQPGLFINGSQESFDMVKDIYKSLGIEFTIDAYNHSSFGECKKASAIEAIFIDPDFSARADLKLLAPVLEAHPSADKKRLYQDTLKYFDTYDFSSKTDTMEGDSLDPFWEYYKAWAPVVENAPTDPVALKAFQAKRAQDMKATRKAITSQIFGCGGNKNEVDPSQ